MLPCTPQSTSALTQSLQVSAGMRAVTHGMQWPSSMFKPNPSRLNAADEALGGNISVQLYAEPAGDTPDHVE